MSTQKHTEFSEYLVFVDESGDHNLRKIDPDFPVFVLLFTIISKKTYVEDICPSLQNLKMKYWGHDEIVLHEHEIRKPRGPFRILLNSDTRSLLLGLTLRLSPLSSTNLDTLINTTGPSTFTTMH
jgi:hypothetical protein